MTNFMKGLIVAPAAAAAGPAMADDLNVALIYGRTGPLEAYAKQTETGLRLGFEYATKGTMTVAGRSAETAHRYNQIRQSRWPWALSPLSTHDTKRSEDVRARLNVLSEVPLEWQECVLRWRRLNTAHRTEIDESPAPEPPPIRATRRGELK